MEVVKIEPSVEDRGWGPDSDALLKNTKRYCKRKAVLHDMASSWYWRLYVMVGLPGILVSAFITCSLIVNLTTDSEPFWFRVFMIALSFCSNSISGVVTFFGLQKKESVHSNTCVRYKTIVRRIQEESTLHYSHRTQRENFFDAVRKDLDEISNTSEPIPSRVLRKYQTLFEKVDPIQLVTGFHDIEFGSRKSSRDDSLNTYAANKASQVVKKSVVVVVNSDKSQEKRVE